MTEKILFIRDEDVDVVSKNIDKIIDKAIEQKKKLIGPTYEEYSKIINIILNFIKKHNRIIYGGYAQNNLIKKKSPNDAFYSDTEHIDIEFYSNKPIEDMVKLCNIFYDSGYKIVQGRCAQHFDTYTIFVDFFPYCDISYMPSNIYHNVIIENYKGLKFIHPKFSFVDILRQLTNPIIDYERRLEKALTRGKLTMDNYPLELTKINNIKIENFSTDILNLITYLISIICSLDTILFIGFTALDVYLNPNKKLKQQSVIYNNNLIEIVSINLKDDVKKIYNLIIKYFLDNKKIIDDIITIEQYYPFFQFLDKKIIFKFKGKSFLIIYGNNERCNPYNIVKFIHNNNNYSIKIGSFNYTFMYFLIKYHLAYINKNRDLTNLYDTIMYKLLESRNNFLDKYNYTVLDKTIFEDYNIDCLGEPVDLQIKFLLSRRDKKLLPKSAIYPYDPEERRDNYDTDMYFFTNTSGNIINNPKDMIINIKK